MFIPNGYTEEQIIDIINHVLNGLVSNFSFGYYDSDDMRQEGFIFAMEALERFDPENEKGCSLENFLRIHIRNRFLNLRRNKLYRSSSPCSSCVFFDGKQCKEFQTKDECPKWSKWMSRNQAKKSLMESSDISNNIHASKHDDEACKKELLKYVSEHIPVRLRADYNRLIEGATLSKTKRTAVVEAVKEIMGDIELESWDG